MTTPSRLLIIAVLHVLAAPQAGQTMALDKLRELYGESTAIATETIPLSDSMQQAVAHLSGVPYKASTVRVQVVTIPGGGRRYAVLDNVLGKEQYITYMVVFDDAERIATLEILAYREAYGGEIRYKSFREQFLGKLYSSDLRIGGDIRNITGATISCQSVTRGVRKVAALFHVIKRLI